MPKILALIDASIYSESVCDHAAWLAGRMAAEIDVLHVLGRRDVSGGGADLTGALDMDARDHLLAQLSELDSQKSKLAQQRGRLVLDHAKTRLMEHHGLAKVTTKLRHGDLVETVQEFEGGADLVAVGKRGEAADFAKLHLGSNLERIVRGASKPVLVASRAFKPISRVLIAFDGGPSVTRALNYLVANPTLFSDLDMTLLSVGAPTPEITVKLKAASDRLAAAGYSVTAQVETGQPEQVIGDKADGGEIDLMVMGAYGHSRIRNLIIGSTTTAMIRSCKIPLVLFR